jgi:hypothetical protein
MDNVARTESVKLLANTFNAIAIALIGGSLFAAWLSPNHQFSRDDLNYMFLCGVLLHGLAHVVLGFLAPIGKSRHD